MTIAEIIRYHPLQALSPYAPFVYSSMPGRRSAASWWVDYGGIVDDSDVAIRITDVLLRPTTQYDAQTSLNDVLDNPESFFWDQANQILYIHIPQDVLPLAASFGYGQADGYTDKDYTYIGDVGYYPAIASIPSLAQSEDLENYSSMAFVSGSMVMHNLDGRFDEIIDDPIYGNRVYLYYLAQVKGQYSYDRSALVPLAALYIEDYKHRIDTFELVLQDIRKSQNANILTEFFDAEKSKPVPLVYGTPVSVDAVQVSDDDTIPVTYRIAQTLTALGTIQCKGNYGWTSVTPISYDLATGTFTISSIYARSPGNGLGEDDGSVLDCRVLSPTGIPNDSVLDVVSDLNDRILGVNYNASNYDTTAWEASKSLLSPIAIVFSKQQKVYDAIAKLQNGSNLRWRYEILPTGLRTAKMDDWDRAIDWQVDWPDIKDNLALEVDTDSELIAASVKVSYAHNDSDDVWSVYTDDSQRENVLFNYRQDPELEIQTYVQTQELAVQRAAQAVRHYSTIPKIWKGVLHGVRFYPVQLLQMLSLELRLPNRAYYGRWKAQVISIDPKFDELSNEVSAVLVERIEE